MSYLLRYKKENFEVFYKRIKKIIEKKKKAVKKDKKKILKKIK